MSQRHQVVLEQANAAIVEGDFDGFLAFCTEDTEWNFVGDRTLAGKAAVREWMLATYVRPPKLKVDRMIADGEHLAALGEVSVTGADGQTTVSAYCDVWSFRDGLLDKLRAYVV